MNRRTLVILCIVTAFATLLASCTAPTPTSTPAATPTSGPVDGPMTKYDPPITITMVRATDDSMETNIFSKLPGETIDDNRWTKLVEEQLGITIKLNWGLVYKQLIHRVALGRMV